MDNSPQKKTAPSGAIFWFFHNRLLSKSLPAAIFDFWLQLRQSSQNDSLRTTAYAPVYGIHTFTKNDCPAAEGSRAVVRMAQTTQQEGSRQKRVRQLVAHIRSVALPIHVPVSIPRGRRNPFRIHHDNRLLAASTGHKKLAIETSTTMHHVLVMNDPAHTTTLLTRHVSPHETRRPLCSKSVALFVYLTPMRSTISPYHSKTPSRKKPLQDETIQSRLPRGFITCTHICCNASAWTLKKKRMARIFRYIKAKA